MHRWGRYNHAVENYFTKEPIFLKLSEERVDGPIITIHWHTLVATIWYSRHLLERGEDSRALGGMGWK